MGDPMTKGLKKILLAPFIVALLFIFPFSAYSEEKKSLLAVTTSVLEYSIDTVKPVIDSSRNKDTLTLLLKVVEVLRDPVMGVDHNQLSPQYLFMYDKLRKTRPAFLSDIFLLFFPDEKKLILQDWSSKYMRKNPADVFFAPSAGEIIAKRAAFGCTHYARAFVAVAKALHLVDKPEDLRYVVSSKADDYNKALQTRDYNLTINGHQFAMVKINSNWVVINTSTGDIATLPQGFSPDTIHSPLNIPIQFESYSEDVVFLLRKIGKDYDDDCGDNSLAALMNISRSGDPQKADFAWDKFNAAKPKGADAS